jgi:hypothetical protein
MLVEQQGWRGGFYGLCIDQEGVGALKRKMNVNPNQSSSIEVHAAFVCTQCHSLNMHNTGKRDEQNILS